MKLKVVDFAEKYQLARESVYRLRKEGKILIGTNRLIDEDLPSNKAWIENRMIRFSEQEITETTPDNTENSSEKGLSLTQLKALNLRLDAEWKTLRNDERSRKLIEVEFVEKINGFLVHNLYHGIYNILDNELTTLLISAGINRDVLTSTRGKLKGLINDLAKSCHEKTQQDLKAYFQNISEQELTEKPQS